jgi:hypothetical protein
VITAVPDISASHLCDIEKGRREKYSRQRAVVSGQGGAVSRKPRIES